MYHLKNLAIIPYCRKVQKKQNTNNGTGYYLLAAYSVPATLQLLCSY